MSNFRSLWAGASRAVASSYRMAGLLTFWPWIALAASQVFAADYTWTGGASGTWSTTAANWNTPAVVWDNTTASGAVDSATFTTGATVAVTGAINLCDVFVTSGSVAINSGTLTFFNAGGAANDYNKSFTVGAGAAVRVTSSLNFDTTDWLSKDGQGVAYVGDVASYVSNPQWKIAAGALDFVKSNNTAAVPPVAVVFTGGGDGSAVLQTNGSFTRTVTTGTYQSGYVFFFNGNGGGFAARGNTLTVTLNNNSATGFTFGSGGFIGSGTAMVFGSTTADNVVTFQNPLNFSGTAQTIKVIDNPNSSADYAVLSGLLSNGGLTKTGDGRLLLSASNSYTGSTTVNAGTLDFNTINALRNSSGVSIAGGATLQYSGTAATFDRNVGVTSGTGTVNNAGGGLLTLSGTLTKNGTVLRLTGGSFNVTGQIVGSSSNSDLHVDGANVTLSNTNSYNGPTYVYNAGTLVLGTNGAIPTGSDLYLGNGGSAGVLNLNGYSNTVNSLTLVSGSVFGAGTLTAGTYALQGGTVAANLGAGTINVTGGTTALGSAGRFNSGSVLTIQSGQLMLSGTESVASYTQSGGILGGSGTVTAASYALNGGTVAANLGAGTISVGGNSILAGSAAAGAVNINAGTFTLSSGGLLASTAAVNATANGATLDISGLSGSGLTIGSLSGSAGSIVTLGGKTLTFGNSNDSTFAGAIGGTGGITKQGAGAVTLSGSNGFSGATAINAGSISFGNKNAFSATSGISIAGGAGLTYTGAADTFSRNITVSTGTGSVTNSGSGVLTLGGTLTKNGTVLRLTGAGGFNVTGQIVGSSSNSDLVVDGASVTLSNTNGYNGPTFVYNGGTLTLGTNSAIPSNSVVTLGGPGAGTLDLGTFTNAIGGLVFSGSGGTLKMAANQTVSAQLVTSASLALGAGTTLDLTGMGTSAGLYKLISFQSQTGTFATVTGLANGYQLVYGSTALEAQRMAVLGTVTVTNPATAIITGGTAAFTYTVANSNASGGASLSFSSTSPSSSVAGSSSGSAAAASPSSSISGLWFTGTGVGSGQTGTFTVNAPGAYGSTVATGTVSVDVYAHASGSAAGTTIALADSIVGYKGSLSGLTSATISNAAGYRVDLMTTGGTSAGFVNINNVSGIGAGNFGMISAAASLDGTQTVGTNSLGQVFSLTYADDSALAGASSNLGGQSITVTGRVLDHASSSLGASLLTSTTVSLGTYNYATNTWESGGSTGFFDIYNLASTFNAGLTADLSLLGVTGAANGFSLDPLSNYSDIAGGQSRQFSILFNPHGFTSGQSATFTITTSDKTGLAGAVASNTLYVTANVIVVPEPGAIALAGIGIAAAAYALRRNKKGK